MRSMGLFNSAALVASIMVLLIAVILVPNQSWSVATITSLVIFAFAAGFVFYVPNIVIKRQGNGNAAQMASIGPLSVITGWMLLLSAGAFVLAILGFSKLAFALDVFAIGTFIISSLILSTALNVVNNAAKQNATPSKHFIWQNSIQGLCAMVSESNSKNSLEKLAEKLRYVASDVSGVAPQNSQIESVIQEITDHLNLDSSASIQSLISKIEVLIAQRDIYLRSVRSKA